MPWYKLPRSNLVMWFDQKMPDLKPGKKPGVKHVKKPVVKTETFAATGGVFRGPMPKLGDISEVVIPNAPEPKEEDEAT